MKNLEKEIVAVLLRYVVPLYSEKENSLTTDYKETTKQLLTLFSTEVEKAELRGYKAGKIVFEKRARKKELFK